MESFIYLYPRGDRLGGHLVQYLSILIYGFYNNLYIYYDISELKYTESIFVKQILSFINNWNTRFNTPNTSKPYIQPYFLDFTKKNDNSFFYSEDLCILFTQVVYNIKSDLISYFKKYIIPKKPSTQKTIAIHLRLDDVSTQSDYDGMVCGNYYKNIINESEIVSGIVQKWETLYNTQRPLSKDKLNLVISQAKEKYPDHEIVIVTSPGEKVDFDYPVITHSNPDDDLSYLCNSDVLILSRSTFSIIAAFMGNASEIWCPVWGHFVCLGLNTKYDKSKFNYFS
uniref:Uncharacterized protein n=1 Tax=viral metagenome TaxID=1070528 RepID=A0A6C0AZ44_9ZZZZ